MARRTGGIVAAVLLASAPAHAEDGAPPVIPIAGALRVEPNACFDAVSLAPIMARWLRRPAVDPRVEVEVAGQVGSPDGLSLRVRRDGHIVGERRFPGLSAPCEEVRAAVGLAAALAVDATVLESLGAKPRPAVAPPPDGPAPRLDARPGVSASLDAAALFGALPSAVPAFAPGLGIRFLPAFELRLSGLFSARGTLVLDRWSVGVSLLAGRADGCAAFQVGFARVRGCAGFAAGRLQAATSGPMLSLSPSAPWAAAIGRADVRVSLRPWFGFVLGGDALLPFTRPQFLVENSGGAQVVGRGLPPIGGAVTLGPEIIFR